MPDGTFESAKLKALALELGFAHVGMAPAEPVDETYISYYKQWLCEGRQGEMHYLENHLDLRRDPRLLLPGAKTVVSLAMNYNPGSHPTQSAIAWYAQGRDYHEVVRERLRHLTSHFSFPTSHVRICVDTAPILEKYWAWRCGLGWIGRHTQLVIPHEGSTFFLAELLLFYEADHYDEPMAPLLSPHEGGGKSVPITGKAVRGGCGSCRRCLDACPTGALTDEGLDARRCLSYLTIEHRGALPDTVRSHLHECFYGCDRCLRACPHLSKTIATPVCELLPSPQLLSMSSTDWASLTREQYQNLFRGSAVKRAKYEGLQRNIESYISQPAKT